MLGVEFGDHLGVAASCGLAREAQRSSHRGDRLSGGPFDLHEASQPINIVDRNDASVEFIFPPRFDDGH